MGDARRSAEPWAGSGISLIKFGAVLFLVTGLLSAIGEGGDCGGTAASCEAFQVAGLTRTRILVGLLVAMGFLAVAAWRSRRWMFQAILLTASALVLMLGSASFVVRMPDWMPILIGSTIPGSLVLLAGAYRRLRFTRLVEPR